MLLWSAKAGCTFAVKWMLDHMGLLQEALAHHKWVHNFRVAKLYAGLAHKASVRDFLNSFEGYRVIKIARNPHKRAVSSYIHAACCGYEDARVSDFLGRPVGKHSGFSFREFVAYLETIDLGNCNVHHRMQVHPLERYFVPGSRFIIDLDQSMALLPKLEYLLGLPRTDPADYRESSHHTRTSSYANEKFSGDTVYDFADKKSAVIPGYRAFYDAELEERVGALYAEDFYRYAFPTSLKEHLAREDAYAQPGL
ncbi:MAG: sulfotransferase family 2 domain-containing protein [Gammaproteobacteria bacterium]|nr:sulfotransferase family 2 domain-containing protein [Gammaproteobacteria bacterium]